MGARSERSLNVGSRKGAVMAFVVAAAQAIGFALRIGPELSWRLLALVAVGGVTGWIMLASVRTNRRWPVAVVALWLAALAVMVWVADLDHGCIDYIGPAERSFCGIIGGPSRSARTASIVLAVAAVAAFVAALRRRRSGAAGGGQEASASRRARRFS